jgi:hypothetical protein
MPKVEDLTKGGLPLIIVVAVIAAIIPMAFHAGGLMENLSGRNVILENRFDRLEIDVKAIKDRMDKIYEWTPKPGPGKN